MNYRHFTARCPHGFAMGIIACEECGSRATSYASSHLRRAHERRAAGTRAAVLARPHGPGFGNRNAAKRVG